MAAIRYIQLKFLVKIPMAYAHLSVMLQKILITLRFRDFLRSFLYNPCLLSLFWELNICSITYIVCLSVHSWFFLCFATYGCCHPCFYFVYLFHNFLYLFQRYVLDLATQLDVRHVFFPCGEIDWYK